MTRSLRPPAQRWSRRLRALDADNRWRDIADETCGKRNIYRQAVDLLATVAALMDADGWSQDFGPCALDIRARHKRKRSLMKLFDQRAW